MNPALRIAVVHSFYDSRVPSGENAVVVAQIEALRDAGHLVTLVDQRTDDRQRRRTYPIEAAVATAAGIGPDPTAALNDLEPDVVHVHNLFPNFGTRWLKQWRGPIVATMHNFRPMCAAASLYRDGDVCTRCPDGDPWASIRHSCYRSSRLATAPLAWRNRNGAATDAVIRRADAVVMISSRSRDVFADAGAPRDCMRVIPNFVDAVGVDEGIAESTAELNGRWLFAGRITPEKGLVELLRKWPPTVPLDVLGDGPDRARAEEVAPSCVTFLGSMPRADVRRRMPAYVGMAFPSLWFEAGPTQVYVEALAAGVPTLAIAGNGTSDDITNHGLGVVVGRRADRAEVEHAIDCIVQRRAELSAECVRSYENRFTVERWLEATEGLYAALCDARPALR